MKQNNAFHRLVGIALLLLLLSAIASAERRTALVIGNAAYEVAPLRNPVHDASDMAMTLRQLGFEVTLLRDADRRTMLEAIDILSRQLRQGGVGLFYFAGHGVQVSGENYLMPLGVRIGREQDVQYEAVPVGRVLGGMEDADNQLNIIILDACRDNPFARQWRSGQRGLAVLQAARGSLIAYATAPGATALDGDGRNGLYTAYLLQHITTPGLSVEHFFKKVREGVVKATKGKQTPWESSSLIGDFSFPSQAAPHQLAAQQRLEEQNRLAAQERQRREREEAEALQRAEAQRHEKERQRLEATKRLEEQVQQAMQSPVALQAAQVARLEPESTLRRRESVAVPAATVTAIRGSGGPVQISAFQMDRYPVSNGEFLAFVRAYPQWKKNQIPKDLHDGDYLKHWESDETLKPDELDLPVRYISYYTALAYCKTFGKTLPGIGNYRAAAKHDTYEKGISITYEASYRTSEFNFMSTEWTGGIWSTTPIFDTNTDEKALLFAYKSEHSLRSTPPTDKRHTGKSLGFRCKQ